MGGKRVALLLEAVVDEDQSRDAAGREGVACTLPLNDWACDSKCTVDYLCHRVHHVRGRVVWLDCASGVVGDW